LQLWLCISGKIPLVFCRSGLHKFLVFAWCNKLWLSSGKYATFSHSSLAFENVERQKELPNARNYMLLPLPTWRPGQPRFIPLSIPSLSNFLSSLCATGFWRFWHVYRLARTELNWPNWPRAKSGKTEPGNFSVPLSTALSALIKSKLHLLFVFIENRKNFGCSIIKNFLGRSFFLRTQLRVLRHISWINNLISNSNAPTSPPPSSGFHLPEFPGQQLARATKVFLIKLAFKINRSWESVGKNASQTARKLSMKKLQRGGSLSGQRKKNVNMFTSRQVKRHFSGPFLRGYKWLRCVLRPLRLAGNQNTQIHNVA